MHSQGAEVLSVLLSLQSSQGVCSLSDQTISVIGDCDVPQSSFIKQLIFFFSSTSTRRMVHTHFIDQHDWHSCYMKETLEIHWFDMCLIIGNDLKERFLSCKNDVSLQFCSRGDQMCEQLVCHLGNLEVGREASVHLEVKLNPDVLLQAPVHHADSCFWNLSLRKRWVSQHWCPGCWQTRSPSTVQNCPWVSVCPVKFLLTSASAM